LPDDDRAIELNLDTGAWFKWGVELQLEPGSRYINNGGRMPRERRVVQGRYAGASAATKARLGSPVLMVRSYILGVCV
jgi:hypothetical protein